MTKRVAVLGAGASGITAIKCCLDEGLEPVCFERTDEMGGLWNFTEKVREDQGCVMRSTVINTSKEMMCYTDFPIPKEYPNFMHNTQVYQYFKDYVKAFKLDKHINYNKEIISVKQSADYNTTGRWDVRMRDHKTGSEDMEVFDAVLVCTGHHASKNMPKFSGQEDFKGKIFHAQDYKDSTGYLGKRVMVIGFGNSGGDIAVELSRVAQVFLSTRRGSWILNRISDGGLPFDFHRTTRYVNTLLQNFPPKIMANLVESSFNKRINHKLYSLQPKHSALSQHPTVNDELPNRLANGTLKLKDDVRRITATGVEFIDGTVEDNIDVIILATGYAFGFPFVDKSVIDVQQNKVKLFKYMFPPDLQKKTLAIIGCFQPIGAIMPIAEMQCRLATRVFKGVCTLPTTYEMWSDIRMKEAKMAARYVESLRHTIQVDYVAFMDELAELIGCKPNLRSLLTSDPRLALKCYFGPCTPYQFRLQGPGVWSGAREAIMTQDDRMRFPLQTRPLPDGLDGSSLTFFRLIVIVAVIAILMKVIF